MLPADLPGILLALTSAFVWAQAISAGIRRAPR